MNYSELPEDAKLIDPSAYESVDNDVDTSENKAPEWKSREPIKVQIPGGRWVGMAEPKTLSPNLYKVMRDVEFADSKLAGAEQMLVTALLYVTDIDDVPRKPLTSNADRMKLEQGLGVLGVQAVTAAWMQEFPPLDQKQLVIVKK